MKQVRNSKKKENTHTNTHQLTGRQVGEASQRHGTELALPVGIGAAGKRVREPHGEGASPIGNRVRIGFALATVLAFCRCVAVEAGGRATTTTKSAGGHEGMHSLDCGLRTVTVGPSLRLRLRG